MQWYVAVVPAQRELTARDLLREHGYDVMVPVEYKWRRKSRYGKAKVERPYVLLTRYVFIGCQDAPNWWHLRHIEFPFTGQKIIQHVLGTSAGPTPLPAEAVSALHLLNLGIPGYNPHKAIRPGGNAQFAEGHPFAGKVVRVREIMAKKARVLIEAFNSMREIEVPLEILEAA